MHEILEAALHRPNIVAFVLLLLLGLYVALAHHNLIKKLIGLYLVQTSVIFFLVSVSAKGGASERVTVPVLPEGASAARAADYVNPLPHVLTLTAIVVQVATLGVSLGIVSAIYKRYGSLDEDAVLKQLE